MKKQTSRILLLSTLVELEACNTQVELFREKFGESVIITEKLAKSVASEFDFDWAARHLLSDSALKIYNETCGPALKIYNETCGTALKIYNETCGPAWEIYKETCGPAWEIYEETCGPALKIYKETHNPAWEIYNKTCNPARKIHKETCAQSFATLYIQNKE